MKKFWADTKGQVVIVFTLALPVVLAALGMAVDFTAWTAQERKLQGIADAAAIAAAREMYMANASDSQVEAVANAVARAQLSSEGGRSDQITVSVAVDDDEGNVEVTIGQERLTYFASFVTDKLDDLSASATARAVGGGRICVIGLDDHSNETVHLQQQSRLTAPDCAVYSNATGSAGIDVASASMMEAELICTAGGYYGNSTSFGPDVPVTDCPQIQDPLAERPAPHVGSCDHNGLQLLNGKATGKLVGALKTLAQNVVLLPGTYCGGLTISNTDLFLLPGIYVVKDGPLEIRSNTALVGENVGFYMTGEDATFTFVSNSIVNLTAPKDGPMAGILFWEDRDAPLDREHLMKSNAAGNLLGTIYMPNGILVVDTNSSVADQSAYTAIIARRLVLKNKPDLFLNADYDQTDIPVPDGIGAVGGNILLER